jgi:hypothetical protein
MKESLNLGLTGHLQRRFSDGAYSMSGVSQGSERQGVSLPRPVFLNTFFEKIWWLLVKFKALMQQR